MERNNGTALLVMDMQASIVGMLPQGAGIVDEVKKAIVAARLKNIPVIYVVVGFRHDMPEVSPRNKSFAASKQRFEAAGINMDDFAAIHPGVAPAAGDIVVTKRRVSAFTGSDLEVILRAWDIKHLVLAGIATGGVVLSTVREAADKDYQLTVLSDCCADPDEEVHRVLTTKILNRQADVINLGQWV